MSQEPASSQDEQALEQQLKSLAPAVKKLLVQGGGKQAALALLDSEGIDQEIAAEFVDYISDIFKIEFELGQPSKDSADAPSSEILSKSGSEPAANVAPADSVFERPAHIAERTSASQQTAPEPPAEETPPKTKDTEEHQPQLPLESNPAPAPAAVRKNLRGDEKIDEVSKLRANVRSILKNPRLTKR